jgi:hypothetical protein
MPTDATNTSKANPLNMVSVPPSPDDDPVRTGLAISADAALRPHEAG